MDRAEALVGELGLSHRVIDICTGDMGIAHHRSWDLEVWSPGVGQWLEASSVSWLSDYQARRANLRYRPTGAKGTELLHTLNGSGLAVPRSSPPSSRSIAARDGSVALPEPLHPYLRGATEIALPA